MPTQQRKAGKTHSGRGVPRVGLSRLPIEKLVSPDSYLRNGAEGETRTRTGISPLPPQGSVSTNFTTSALFSLFLLLSTHCGHPAQLNFRNFVVLLTRRRGQITG